MAKVIGLGGVFFKVQDPQTLGAWYQKWLGVPVDATWGGAVFKPDEMPTSAYSVWSPFPADTQYFTPAEQSFMVNLVVDDLDGALAQVVEGGATLAGEIDESEFGRFGWFLDPEGNKVELWQPPVRRTEIMNATATGMKENVASGLCYVLGWFTGLIFLLIEQDNQQVRFHAWQSILVFGSLSLLGVIAGWLPILGGLLAPLVSIATVVLWIVLMVKAFQGKRLSLPIAGPIAEDWAKRSRTA